MKAQEILDALRTIPQQELLDTLAREHRTNQQLIAAPVFAIIRHWSDAHDTNNWDLRNQATVHVASTMQNAVSDEVFLPYI